MISLLSRYSSLLLIVAAAIGFAFPVLSATVFPSLPYILFFLMLFTLLGMPQSLLLSQMAEIQIWIYAIFHSTLLTLLSCFIAITMNASDDLILAIAAISATGSLFATPAIARSVGLEPLKAMAMTIASTLLMPVVLYINLMIFQDEQFSLDITSYLQRLVIFILGPMLFSAICYRLIPYHHLHRIHGKLSQVTIILVLAFPFGLIGPFREVFEQSLTDGFFYLAIGVAICSFYFFAGYLCYRYLGLDQGLLVAITSANRNVLLTYTVAGSYLGPDFLVLMGALQLPTYCLPLIIKGLYRYTEKVSTVK
ncbi:hypothetical protein [uncultured Photobacterium sp.]|uniref:hypothetical protein n=1 Tax=uncultured Photobacterium sp. TaxID=173973 RepID=UPI002636A2BB|nr:hypothetical protein [uncultured Photobacterium sp.]